MGKKIAALLTILAIIFTVAIFTPDSNAGIQTLNLSKQTKEIKVGESFQLTMTGVKSSSIKWKSSKPSVATVNKKGVIRGLSTGTTNITGKYKSLKFTIVVTVKAKDTQTSKPSKGDQLIYSDDKAELYYVGVSDGYGNDNVNFKVISKMNETLYWGFDVIYLDGEQATAHMVEKAMPDMEAKLSTYIDKGKKPKKIKGILFSYSPDTGKTKYSKEFSYTVK